MWLARKTLKDREGGIKEDVSDSTRRLTRFIRTLHRNTYGLIGSVQYVSDWLGAASGLGLSTGRCVYASTSYASRTFKLPLDCANACIVLMIIYCILFIN